MSNETSRVTDLKDLRDLGTAVRGTQAPAAAPRYERKVDAQGRSYATGKRKDAIARVWIKPGGPSRHQPRPDPVRAGPPARAESGRLPDPRQPHGRA